jgi:hypothetical protein
MPKHDGPSIEQRVERSIAKALVAAFVAYGESPDGELVCVRDDQDGDLMLDGNFDMRVIARGMMTILEGER